MTPRTLRTRSTATIRGSALLLPASMLALVTVLLGALLSVLVARRASARKVLLRDLVEIDALSALSSLRSDLKVQLQTTGEMVFTRWIPDPLGISFTTVPLPSQPVFERDLSVSGSTGTSPSPRLGIPLGSATQTGPFAALNRRVLATPTIRGLWRPLPSQLPQPDSDFLWEFSTDLKISQVPLSAFTIYSSCPQFVLGEPEGALGRFFSEGDVQVDAFQSAARPFACAGELRFGAAGALVLAPPSRGEFRAFSQNTDSQDARAQADGWIFNRDGVPVWFVRPATTGELFSRIPLPLPGKEAQRLKPQCLIQIQHALGAFGEAVCLIEGALSPGGNVDLGEFVSASGDTLELDLSKWPASLPRASAVWLESTVPEVRSLTLRGAESLGGDLSIATDMDIHLIGSFNTTPPVRRASLLTKGRVLVMSGT